MRGSDSLWRSSSPSLFPTSLRSTHVPSSVLSTRRTGAMHQAKAVDLSRLHVLYFSLLFFVKWRRIYPLLTPNHKRKVGLSLLNQQSCRLLLMLRQHHHPAPAQSASTFLHLCLSLSIGGLFTESFDRLALIPVSSAAEPIANQQPATTFFAEQTLTDSAALPPVLPQVEVPETAVVTRPSELNIRKKTSITSFLRRASPSIRSASSIQTPSLRSVPPAEAAFAEELKGWGVKVFIKKLTQRQRLR
ncbi:hypothetical protein C8F04DRAFT_1266420 [Mycena alexandri]|uniref:Uncharacterized protein n=1 Tax=Mycena alexandri TaxID=1745969 RepID=A0AAD6SKZ0_9AGAR|nr:hypothetical protein C8F04DRAFT_1266420 [Mycena alexandri]